MYSSNSSKRTSTNDEQSTQCSQTTKILSDSLHNRMPSLSPYIAKPMISQKIKTRPPYNYPKHTEASSRPSISTNHKTPKIVKDQNTLLPEMPEDTTKNEVSAKETPSTNSLETNSKKTNTTINHSNNQWWMDYDKFLRAHNK